MAQIRSVVSESLQAEIRRLLPSQQGFTEDLQATNVITPVIDITPASDGSAGLPQQLQEAFGYSDITDVSVNQNQSNSVLINNTGFWKYDYQASFSESNADRNGIRLRLYNGSSYKTVQQLYAWASGNDIQFVLPMTGIVFLPAGHSLRVSTDAQCNIRGSHRQIADVDGNLVNPTDYTGS